MKFRCEQGILAEALGALARVATARNAGTPALAGAKMTLAGDTLVLSATDQEIALQFTVTVGGERDGQGLVSAKMLNDIVRVMPSGAVTIDVGPDSAVITAQRSTFTVPTLNAVEFPRTNAPMGDGFTISSESFRAALSQVTLAAAGESSNKPHLTGVLVTATDRGIRLVATDGYRLAMRDIVGASGLTSDSFLVPARALNELQRILDKSEEVVIRFNDVEAVFSSPVMHLSTRLINAKYPPYETIIANNNTNTVTVSSQDILDALRRTRVLSSEMAPVRIRMSNEGLHLTVQLTDGSTSNEDVDAAYSGEETTMAFNSEYLANGITACGTEEVTISSGLNNKPATIRPVGDDTYLYVIMPQRL